MTNKSVAPITVNLHPKNNSMTAAPPTSSIKVLPPEIVARIAAGEVVERPASIVKELVENALDADASRIDADIESGGIARVRVSDDGTGMSPEDLAVAVQPHATSKLADADQLHTLETLGFRGEALPSIASVSRFSIVSRKRQLDLEPSDDAIAWRVDVDGGRPEIPAPRPAAGPYGSTVEARELFFNLPARQKFLKGLAAEAAACADTFLRLALTRPDVAFTLRQGRSELLALPAATARASTAASAPQAAHAAPSLPAAAYFRRAREALGRALSKGLVEVDFTDRPHDSADSAGGAPYRLYGLLSPPAVTRPNRGTIYLTVNGRAVKDRTLTSALLESFRHLLAPRRFPIAVLYLDLPGADVDINVHPAKSEVRFRLPSRIYALFYHAVRSASGLAAADTRAETGDARVQSVFANRPFTPSTFIPARPPVLRADLKFPAQGPLFVAPAENRGADSTPPSGSDYNLWPTVQPDYSDRMPESVQEAPSAPYGLLDACAPKIENAIQRDATPAADFRVIGQAAGSYIVVEDESGVRLIDQHALHERILFERLLAAAQARSRGDSQGLLVPETVELSAAQAALISSGPDTLSPSDKLSSGPDTLELLAHLGFDCEPFGPRALLVRAVPAIVKSTAPARLVSELLEALAAGDEAPNGGQKALRRWTLREKAAYILSCKAAIKAGERLTHEQMNALMAEFQAVAGPFNAGALTCPHGRPLALELSWYDLERAVGRK